MSARHSESVRQAWERLPLAWDAARVSRASRTVAWNWRTMTDDMRARVREFARARGVVTLVDIGCGNGGFTDGLENVIERYIGVDPAIEMLRIGRAREGYAYALGVAERLPFPDGIADVVVIKTVLTHCYSPEEALREAARVMKPGGIAIVSTANRHAWYHAFRRLRRAFERFGSAPDGHLHMFDEAELIRLSAESGLRPLCQRTLGYAVLPRAMDRYLSPELVARFCERCDAIGRRLFPSRGGALIYVAEKPG